MITVIAAVIKQDNKILIAQRKEGKTLAGKWEFPGGKLEANETPQQCLIRELKEELDIAVKIQDYIGSSKFDYDNISIDLQAYEVKYISGKITLNDHQNIKWVNVEDLINYDFAEADKPIIAYLLSKSRIPQALK